MELRRRQSNAIHPVRSIPKLKSYAGFFSVKRDDYYQINGDFELIVEELETLQVTSLAVSIPLILFEF